MTEKKESFKEIYDRFHPEILRFLSRYLGADEAEDVAQEVFLRVDRGVGNFRRESSVKTWIYSIARNAAIDRLRSRSARNESEREFLMHDSEEGSADGCSGIPAQQVSIEQHLIGKEMGECIRGRVDRLPESYRSVLLLSDVGGMTNAEIASAVGTSEGAVKIRLHRARARLRKELGAHCTLYRDERDELACEPISAQR